MEVDSVDIENETLEPSLLVENGEKKTMSNAMLGDKKEETTDEPGPNISISNSNLLSQNFQYSGDSLKRSAKAKVNPCIY